MHVFLSCKFNMFKKNLINSNQEKVKTSIFRHSRAANSIVTSQWSHLAIILTHARYYMHVFVTSNFKKNLINSNQEKVETSNFLDAQGQLTPLSVVGNGRNSNSSKLLCMSLLLAIMKRIPSKTAKKM